jgi:CheY-like chemotaxis protein
MSAKRVVSLGQCAADHYSIGRLITTHFQAEVIPVDRPAEAFDLLREATVDLILVNRLLDRDGSSGLDFIRKLKADEGCRDIPVMLVSNHADAQRQAVERGALAGFGKAELSTPATLDRLRAVLQPSG